MLGDMLLIRENGRYTSCLLFDTKVGVYTSFVINNGRMPANTCDWWPIPPSHSKKWSKWIARGYKQVDIRDFGGVDLEKPQQDCRAAS